MPCAIVVGCAPVVAAFTGAAEARRRPGRDGGRRRSRRPPDARHPRKTVDLEIPADAEIVVEGFIDTELLEPEGPFGESHGHVALEEFNMSMRVTAITRKRKAYHLDHQRGDAVEIEHPEEIGLRGAVPVAPQGPSRRARHQRVVMHEPLTNLRPVLFLQFAGGAPQTEVWRGLQGAASLQAQCGKIVIAVSEDIDPAIPDAGVVARLPLHQSAAATTCWWCLPNRRSRAEIRRRPCRERRLLIDATLKQSMPPLALPARPYMRMRRRIQGALHCLAACVQAPWYGYSPGDWSPDWHGFRRQRRRATGGRTARTFCAQARRAHSRDALRNVEGKKP